MKRPDPAELAQTVTEIAVGTAHLADFLSSKLQPMPKFGSPEGIPDPIALPRKQAGHVRPRHRGVNSVPLKGRTILFSPPRGRRYGERAWLRWSNRSSHGF